MRELPGETKRMHQEEQINPRPGPAFDKTGTLFRLDSFILHRGQLYIVGAACRYAGKSILGIGKTNVPVDTQSNNPLRRRQVL